MSDDKQKQPTFRGRGGVLEHGEPFDRIALRRPGNSSDKGSGDHLHYVPPVSSTLSPMAVEFVPSSALRSATSSASTSTSFSTPSFQPRRLQPPPHTKLQQPQQYENGESETEITLEHLRTIMFEITVNPGKFDTLATLLVDALGAMIRDEETLAAVVHEILAQSIAESNFRYNGARLCNCLSKNLNLTFSSQGFRATLFQRCQEEFGQKDVLCQENSPRLRDFTMFMGELFIHLEIQANGVTQKVELLGRTVLQLLRTLLRYPLKENLKCVCQMLKFTGAALEDYERSCNKGLCPFMDELFQVMKMLAVDDRIERNCKELLVKVVDLRASDWGRVASSLVREESVVNDNPGTDPVMYGPDGQPLSKEEALFLESNAQYLYDTNSTEDEGNEAECYGRNQSLWSTSDGMDDEMAAAFEEFLLESTS